MSEQRVSEHDLSHIIRHNASDPATGRGSVIPNLALDLRDAGADIERLTRERDEANRKLDVLRRAINENDPPCDADCDSFGHTETCKHIDPAAWFAMQQERLAAARASNARLREALDEAQHAFHEKAHPGHPALKAMVRVETVERWRAALSATEADDAAWMEQVRAQERERCAKIVEDSMNPWNTGHRALSAIRALSAKPEGPTT